MIERGIRDFKVSLTDHPSFLFNLDQIKEFLGVAEKVVARIRKSKSPREMVMETWLLIDYRIRELLLDAFDLLPYNNEAFDLRYEFLPQSFRGCLTALQKLKKAHLSRRPLAQRAWTISGGFVLFIAEEYDKELFHQIEKAERAYYRKLYPITGPPPIKYDPNYYVDKRWLEVVNHLPESWFKKAKQLNDARNIAAHTFDEYKILSRFGIKGHLTIQLTRKFCLKLITEIVGIIPRKMRKRI